MPKYIMTVPQQCRVILVWVPPEGEFETRNSGANTSGGAGKGQYRHGNWDRDEKADHKGHVHKQVSPTSSWGSTPIQEPLKDIRQDYATHSEGRWAFTQQLSSVVGWGLRWGKTRNCQFLGIQAWWAYGQSGCNSQEKSSASEMCSGNWMQFT